MELKEFGKYTLMGRLGGGGMAEVFRARLHGPGGFTKDLALKLILPQFSDDPEFVKMFIQEATLAAKLDHANIVRIYEFDQIGGRYYIAMELVEGRDLRQVLARGREVDRRIKVPEALVVAQEACQGLSFAHGELTPGAPEIVHRDVSPHNLILSRAGEVKITDFGIAKMAAAACVTRTGVIKGKASYMSPEQSRGNPVDRRSDLFSLGCVLWELLTGQRLFAGENDLAILDKLQRGPILAPSAFNREVPPELDAALVLALEREPFHRFPSASAMGRALDKILVRFSDVDRGTVLAKLYSELFPPGQERPGTAVLLLAEAASAESAVEPIGPDAATLKDKVIDKAGAVLAPGDAAPPPSPPVPNKSAAPAPAELPMLRSRLRSWTWIALAALALCSVAIATVVWMSGGTGKQHEIVPGVESALRPMEIPAGEESPSPATNGVSTPAAEEPTPDSTDGGSEPSEGRASAMDNPNNPAPPPSTLKVEGRAVTRPQASGRLDLNAIPWAQVYWGKRYLGETPLEGKVFPAGDLVLVLKNQVLGKTRTIRVKIQAQKTTKQVVDLRKDQ